MPTKEKDKKTVEELLADGKRLRDNAPELVKKAKRIKEDIEKNENPNWPSKK